jgi:DinB superfamily
VASGDSQIDGLIRELRQSSEQAEALRAGRAEAELLRRPGEKRWSAAESVEHLNLSNRAYLPRIEEALGALRQKKLTGGGPFRLEWNARLLKYWLEPPSRLRLPTGAAFQPVEVKHAAATFAEFSDLNRKLEEQLESADGLNLSGAKIVSPFAKNMKYSAYSAFVLIAAHNRRHLWQAERALREIRHV